MGVTPICLSAGELEDEWAGEPGRRLRERYSYAGGFRALRCAVLCCEVLCSPCPHPQPQHQLLHPQRIKTTNEQRGWQPRRGRAPA
jgi:hypothetical protein